MESFRRGGLTATSAKVLDYSQTEEGSAQLWEEMLRASGIEGKIRWDGGRLLIKVRERDLARTLTWVGRESQIAGICMDEGLTEDQVVKKLLEAGFVNEALNWGAPVGADFAERLVRGEVQN